MGSERGQAAVEWLALLLLVALLLAAMLAAGVRLPGTTLADAIAQRILCAAALADSCGDEPELIAAYGTEIGRLVREHMPSIAFEHGSRALPVDFRRCRSTSCGDGSARGFVARTDSGLPITAFVHVVDCRRGGADRETPAARCSGERGGRLYIQYWTYYADSASLRGIPGLAAAGYHRDDWESVQLRFDPDGGVSERASSHQGYNYAKSVENWGSDAGLGPLRDLAEALGGRAPNGWGPETHLLVVSGGSHAGNAIAAVDTDRLAPGRRVRLIPLEPLAPAIYAYRFAVNPPWLKTVWWDPEAEGTD